MLTCNASDFIKLSKDILSEGNILRFRAKGWSMTPFIRNEEVVQVESAAQNEIRIGDIVFYYREKQAVVHRIIKKRKENGKLLFLIKGDASLQADGSIEPGSIIGRIIAIEKNGKIIKLNSAPMRCINYLCALLSPYSSMVYPFLIRVKRWVAL